MTIGCLLLKQVQFKLNVIKRMSNLNNKIPDGPCNTYVKINENCFLFIKGSTLLDIENVTCETSFHQKKKNRWRRLQQPDYFAASASLEPNICLTLPSEDRILFQSMKNLSLNHFSGTPGVSTSQGTKNLLLERDALVAPQSICPTPPGQLHFL